MSRAAVTELWERIEPILDTALELPPECWPAYLDNACGANTPLRAAVERLLASAGTTTAATDTEIGAVAWAQPILVERELAAPSRIGPYVIDHVLGRGGMGSVYLAARDDTEFSPRVALKVMRNGLDQDRVLLRRFTEERQILATLEHPGVARLLEGGVTSDGHPWFAMEFVDGMPLNRYVEAHALTLTDKLRIFLQVVDTVSYAHRNLIVHRDLKPSNILVTANGTIKLLDFGIAKLLAPSVAGDAPITRTGFQPFTPEYASPEQVLGEPVTTSADVYALGVVLYELLTGERPLNLMRTNPADWARIVRESELRAPSTVVADGRALRGDLDTIALMALRREPDRRYASVDRMSDDVRRHLEQRPVLARTDGGMYRTRKFLRRRRAVMITATIIAAGLVAFGVIARSQNASLKRESDRTAGIEARAIRAQITPGVMDQEASATLGSALMGSEKYAQAESLFRELVAVQEQHPANVPETPALILLGEALRRQGRNEEASVAFRQELARLEAAPELDSETVASALSYLAAAQAMMGHSAVADSLMRRAYAMLAATQPIQFQRIGRGTVLASRAELAARAGDDAKAAPLADSARALWNETLPPGDARWSALARVEALLLRDRRQPAAAVARLAATLDTLRSRPHPNLYTYRRTEATLADVFDRWGQPDSAAAHLALSRPGAPLRIALARKH